MVGKYEIEIYDNHISYHLEIKRNITVIQGNSATGKSELIRMLSDYNRAGASSGITVICEKTCLAMVSSDWTLVLPQLHDNIIFIDENNSYIKTRDFAEIVNKSDNYFVLICRDGLPMLSYSVEEIYGFRQGRPSQKYLEAKRVYNEMYRIYNLEDDKNIKPDIIVTEDSNSGYEFFKTAVSCKVLTAKGKSRMAEKIRSLQTSDVTVLSIVDGAAFGADMGEYTRQTENALCKCYLYAPESFEYLILMAGICEIPREKLERTYDFADSTKYSSWERFYYNLLVENTKETVYKYSKRHINKSYLTAGSRNRIMSQLPQKLSLLNITS